MLEKLWLDANYDPDAGDISGNGNDGTITGGVTHVADDVAGTAWDFDGSTGYIEGVLPIGSLDSTSFTYSAWVAADSTTTNRRIISTGTGTDGVILKYENGKCQFVVGPAHVINHTPSPPIVLGVWMHWLAVYDITVPQLRLYRNGNLVASATGPASYAGAPVNYAVGRRPGNNSEYFDGLIIDVRIYDIALTDTQIRHLATHPSILGAPRTSTLDNEVLFIPGAYNPLDQVGSNDGTKNGDATAEPDNEFGGFAQGVYDGTGDYVSTTEYSLPTSPSPLSIGCWAKSDASPNSLAHLWSQQTSDRALYYASGNWKYNNDHKGTNLDVLFPATLDTDLHHYMLVDADQSDSTEGKLFIDGVEIARSGTGSTAANANSAFQIGTQQSGAATSNWTGEIDGTLITSDVLTAAEINHQALTRGIPPTIYTRTGEIARWCSSLQENENALLDPVGGYAGTLENGAEIVVDVDGGAFAERAVRFDGVDDYSETPSSVDSSTTGSISLWFRTSDTATNAVLLGSTQESTALRYFMVRLNNGAVAILTRNNDTAESLVTDTGGWNDGAWHHVVAVSSGTAYTIYVDGVSKAFTGDDTGRWLGDVSSRDSVTCGARHQSGSVINHYDGSIDDIRIYNTAIDQTEVDWLYNSGLGRGRNEGDIILPPAYTKHPLQQYVSTHPLGDL